MDVNFLFFPKVLQAEWLSTVFAKVYAKYWIFLCNKMQLLCYKIDSYKLYFFAFISAKSNY